MTACKMICEPKVSVIIPVYNVKAYLKEALGSVINQTYKNLEIILVDDGSDDGSEIICDEYAKKDSRIKVIHRENGGLSAARNTGLDNMSGEYVAFLDSDDAFIPEAIERLLDTILSNDADCVVFKRINCKTSKNGKLRRIYFSKKVPSLTQGVYSGKEALKAVADKKLNALVWTKFSKRKIWEDIRFPEGHVYEDLYTVFSTIEKAERIYMLNENLVLYRMRSGSISATKNLKNTEDFLDSWSVFEKYIETHTSEIFEDGQLQETRKKFLAELIMYYAKVLSMYFSEKSEVLNLLKENILKLAEDADIRDYDFEIRTVYHLVRNSSKSISMFFPIICKFYKCFKCIKMYLTKD